jgi:hypothetical protein
MNWTGAYDSRFLAEDWTGLLEQRDRWVHDYNVQEHYAQGLETHDRLSYGPTSG